MKTGWITGGFTYSSSHFSSRRQGETSSFWFLQTRSNFKSIVSSGGSSHSLQAPRKFQGIFGIYDAARDLAKSWADWLHFLNGLKVTPGDTASETGSCTKCDPAPRLGPGTGAGVSSQHPGKHQTGHCRVTVGSRMSDVAVSGCSLPRPQLMSWGADEEQTQTGAKRSDPSLVCRGKSP